MLFFLQRVQIKEKLFFFLGGGGGGVVDGRTDEPLPSLTLRA